MGIKDAHHGSDGMHSKSGETASTVRAGLVPISSAGVESKPFLAVAAGLELVT
jgi:hypothetical protein